MNSSYLSADFFLLIEVVKFQWKSIFTWLQTVLFSSDSHIQEKWTKKVKNIFLLVHEVSVLCFLFEDAYDNNRMNVVALHYTLNYQLVFSNINVHLILT